MMSDVCKHCVAAPCQQACPTGAIIYNEFGNVYIQPDICNGCAYCIAACPFGVITRATIDGHAHKCTLCFDRQNDGLVPACAKACPTASIQFGPVDELRERARKRVEELHGRGVTGAYLYGDAPRPRRTPSSTRSTSWSTGPRCTACPTTPFNPWLHMKGDYLRAAGERAGLAGGAGPGPAARRRHTVTAPINMDPRPAATARLRGRPVTKPPNWHGLVALDVLLNNLTTGLFLVAAVGELLAPARSGRWRRWRIRSRCSSSSATSSALVLDLGDPLRFHHMLRVFKPSSPMSLGTWCSPPTPFR